MIYYLAQAYTSDRDAFPKAVEWTAVLRSMGFVIFSPILHTHPYHRHLGRDRDPKVCGFCGHTLHIKCPSTIPDQVCDTDACPYRKDEDYVAWDLALCDGWLKQDATFGIKGFCKETFPRECRQWDRDDPKCWEECMGRTERRFDSGLTLLFAPSCFSTWDKLWDNEDFMYCDRFAYTDASEQDHWWISKGAKIEYDWAKAKAHHVRCLLLEPFLQGNEVEI